MIHFREPKHRWGFNSPNPNLIKVPIDLRPPHMGWQSYPGSPLASVTNQSGQLSLRASSSGPKEGERVLNFPPLIRKENQKPGSSSRQGPLFGSSVGPYFGGPIFEKVTSDWRVTFYTRSNGEIIGAAQNQIPLPPNINVIIRSTCVMVHGGISQSGFWVGPRLFVSTLHFHTWIGPRASFGECEQFRQSGVAFSVESELSRKIITEYSPRAQLVAFDIDNDLGLFKLQDQYPDQKDFIEISWILERDEAYNNQLPVASKAACCGYSGAVSEADSKHIQDQAAHHLSKVLVAARPVINLDHVTKPDFKSFAPGTIDFADAKSNAFRYGISASVWKGSSGGPCFLLDGPLAGAIIGTVRGGDLFEAPYNSINGFSDGIKDALKKWL